MGTLATRIGGAFGILSVLAVISAFVVGTPDTPHTPDEARHYYDSGSAFVTANGAVPLLHILFGIVFVGALTSMLIRATGPRAEIYIALAGGVIWLALTAAGLAAEVAYPAAIVRFGDVTVTGFTQPLLTLSTWLYHYCQLGAAAMILSASISIWRTGVLPKWASALGILGIPPLLHLWFPLPAAISTLVWVGFIGLVMLIGAKRTAPAWVEARAAETA
ncbi:MAG: hypothetical protein JO152_03110 [Mycobacteriaceae bacterium]|nr:hypothetical protein [Mycobacteriaceae bacterium]